MAQSCLVVLDLPRRTTPKLPLPSTCPSSYCCWISLGWSNTWVNRAGVAASFTENASYMLRSSSGEDTSHGVSSACAAKITPTLREVEADGLPNRARNTLERRGASSGSCAAGLGLAGYFLVKSIVFVREDEQTEVHGRVACI
eukprot:369506-Prorocentrum_minimum.AAC.3